MKFVYTLILLSLITACGGGGGGEDSSAGGSTNEINQNIELPKKHGDEIISSTIYGGVANLNYKAFSPTSYTTGTTDANGQFKCHLGYQVKFFISHKLIYESTCREVENFISHKMYVTHAGSTYIGLLMLLLNLDEDVDPSNGIKLVKTQSPLDSDYKNTTSFNLTSFLSNNFGRNIIIKQSETELYFIKHNTTFATYSGELTSSVEKCSDLGKLVLDIKRGNKIEALNSKIVKSIDLKVNESHSSAQRNMNPPHFATGPVYQKSFFVRGNLPGHKDTLSECGSEPIFSITGLSINLELTYINIINKGLRSLQGYLGFENALWAIEDNCNGKKKTICTGFVKLDHDNDSDGVKDQDDKMPNDPSDYIDTDKDGIGNLTDDDDDNDGVVDSKDAFPLDFRESKDSDGDGVGDKSDLFPNNANDSTDRDGDGVGDNSDAFPDDASESKDSDGDGVGDNRDDHPNNPNIAYDRDKDGVKDSEDAFPDNASESKDSDGDESGDNADTYPINHIRAIIAHEPLNQYSTTTRLATITANYSNGELSVVQTNKCLEFKSYTAGGGVFIYKRRPNSQGCQSTFKVTDGDGSIFYLKVVPRSDTPYIYYVRPYYNPP